METILTIISVVALVLTLCFAGIAAWENHKAKQAQEKSERHLQRVLRSSRDGE